MRVPFSLGLPFLLAFCALQLNGCGAGSESAHPATKEALAKTPKQEHAKPVLSEAEPEAELVQAYVGEQKRIVGAPLELPFDYYGEFDGKAVISIRLPEDWLQNARTQAPSEDATFFSVPSAVRVEASSTRVRFLLQEDSDPSQSEVRSAAGARPKRDTIWLLTDVEDVGLLKPSIWVNFNENDPDRAVVQVPVQLTGPGPAGAERAEPTWGRALFRYFQGALGMPFANIHVSHLHELYGKSEGRHLRLPDLLGQPTEQQSELSELMSLFSGARSVELALERRRWLSVKAQSWKPSKKLSSLQAPVARKHDWTRMLRGLVARESIPLLSQSVPAEFYFVHAKSGEALFAALDELDIFLSPAVHLIEESGSYYGVSERYQTMLGLKRGALTRGLGPEVVRETAVIGSDPFLRLGSDLTVIFEANHPRLLALGLAHSFAKRRAEHPGITEEQIEVAGHSVRRSVSQDGAIRQYFLQQGSRFFVSNSEAALRRVLLTHDGQHPRLSDEPDFRYMIHRDKAAGTDVLVYVGDRFIQAAVSPRARILDSRRAIARGELMSVSYHALLRGFFGNKIETEPELLLAEKWLTKGDLKHFDGSKIGEGPASNWGTPSHMKALIDHSTPLLITAEEAGAYKDFAAYYQRSWGENLDPIALRLKLKPNGKGFEAHLRVLPLTNDPQYRRVQDLVGDTRLEFRGPALGLQMVLALSKKSGFRSEVVKLTSEFLGGRNKLDWLGSYAFVGVEDKNDLANALHDEFAPGRDTNKGGDWLGALEELPLYGGLAITSRAAADLALSALKLALKLTEDVTSHKSTPYAGSLIESLEFPRSHFRIYFALGQETLFASFQEGTIKRLLDLEGAKKLPLGSKQGRAQWGLETKQKPGGALSTLIAWVFEEQFHGSENAQLRAEYLAMALPSARQQSSKKLEQPQLMTLLGELPITPDGLFFSVGATGAYDGKRWNGIQRKWPSLPVAGSYLESVLGRLKQVRFEMAFEPEAPDGSGSQERSLSIHTLVERQ